MISQRLKTYTGSVELLHIDNLDTDPARKEITIVIEREGSKLALDFTMSEAYDFAKLIRNAVRRNYEDPGPAGP